MAVVGGRVAGSSERPDVPGMRAPMRERRAVLPPHSQVSPGLLARVRRRPAPHRLHTVDSGGPGAALLELGVSWVGQRVVSASGRRVASRSTIHLRRLQSNLLTGLKHTPKNTNRKSQST